MKFSSGVIWSLTLAVILGADALTPARGQCERTEDQEIPAPVLNEQYRFGNSTAVDGSTAVVGAGTEGVGQEIGAAYVYQLNGSSWSLITELHELVELEPNDFFGNDVAVEGEWIIVGATHDDIGGQVDQGSAWVFKYDAASGEWERHQQLIGWEGKAGDFFGATIAISGDQLLVGAHRDGAVYVYQLSGDKWGPQTILRQAGGWFGGSLDLDADRAVIGAWRTGSDTGMAYVYGFNGSSWNLVQQLTASDRMQDDQFGRHLAIDGNTIGITAPGRGGVGAAYLYCFNGTQWVERDIVTPADAADGDSFGMGFAMNNGLAVVGSTYHRHTGTASGSAYVYRYQDCNWVLECELLPSDGLDGDRFGGEGHPAATDGATIFIGASLHDHAGIENSGAAYFYDFSVGCGLKLTVDGTCPGGGPIEISWCGATPNGKVALIFSLDLGGVLIPAGFPCQGTLLGLGPNQIQRAALLSSDANGKGLVSGFAGNGACGGYLQLLDLTSCEVSNVALIK